MDMYEGVYVFDYHQPGDIIELAPGIEAEVIQERISLYKTSRKQHQNWEGDLKLALSINNQEVFINDHDEQNNKKSYFFHKGGQYYIQGQQFNIEEDEIVRLYYVVHKQPQKTRLCQRCLYSKVESTSDLSPSLGGSRIEKLNQIFTIDLYNNPTTGSSIKLEPSPGLEIVDKEFTLSNNNVGAGGTMRYYLKGTTRGEKELIVHQGQMWYPDSLTKKVIKIRIV